MKFVSLFGIFLPPALFYTQNRLSPDLFHQSISLRCHTFGPCISLEQQLNPYLPATIQAEDATIDRQETRKRHKHRRRLIHPEDVPIDTCMVQLTCTWYSPVKASETWPQDQLRGEDDNGFLRARLAIVHCQSLG